MNRASIFRDDKSTAGFESTIIPEIPHATLRSDNTSPPFRANKILMSEGNLFRRKEREMNMQR